MRPRLYVTLAALFAVSPLLAQPAPSGPEWVVSSPSGARVGRPSVHASWLGWIVVWEDQARGIVTRALGPDGAPRGTEIVVAANDPVPLPFRGVVRLHREPVVVSFWGGDSMLFWTEETVRVSVDIFYFDRQVLDRRVLALRLGPDGGPAGSPLPVAPGALPPATVSAVRLQGGRALVVWEGRDEGIPAGLWGRIYRRDGRPADEVFRVDDRGWGSARPALSALAAGGFIVSWQACCDPGGDRGIRARLFDASGTPVSRSEFVNERGDGRQGTPQVGGDGSDGFLVVWSSPQALEPRGYRLFGRRLDARGRARGAELQLGLGVGRHEAAPHLLADSSGSLLLTWIVWDGSFRVAILGQSLGPGEGASSDAFLLNEGVLGASNRIGLARRGRHAMAVWEGFDEDGRTAIVARLLAPQP